MSIFNFVPTISMTEITANIRAMHQMYSLPDPGFPTLVNERHSSFMNILQKEVDEGKDIALLLSDLADMRDDLRSNPNDNVSREQVEDLTREILTAYADWLEDIQVYCHSEMMRLGISRACTNAIIATSNATKLAADGSVIKDADGKVCKGPNFIPPEPTLRSYINSARARK